MNVTKITEISVLSRMEKIRDNRQDSSLGFPKADSFIYLMLDC
jgi:hypothetical protein